MTTGWVSASSVVSHTEPHHTPCAPSAIAAAIWRPRPMPPAPSTGMSPTASTISGISTIVPISPVCPPASLPWAMTTSTPALTWRSACCAAPARARHGAALLLDALDHVRRRRAEGVDEQHRPAGERDLELEVGAAGRERGRLAAADQPAASGVGGQLGHVVAIEDVVDELAVAGRDHLLRRPTSSARPRRSRRTWRGRSGRRRTGGRRSRPRSSRGRSRAGDRCDRRRRARPCHPPSMTATTTSRQWVKARIGTSMPNMSVIAVFMRWSSCAGRAVPAAPDRWSPDRRRPGRPSIHSRASGPLVTSCCVVDVAALRDDEAEVLGGAGDRIGRSRRRPMSTRPPTATTSSTRTSPSGASSPPVAVAPPTGDHAELGDVTQPIGGRASRHRPRRRRPGRAPTPPSNAR